MYKLKTPSTKTLFFLKSFLKNFLLLMLPLVIVSTYSMYCFNQNTAETIESRNWNLMYQIKTQTDPIFQMKDNLSSLLTESSSVSATLQDTFLEETLSPQTTKQVRILSQYMQSIIDSNIFAHSAYLYFDNTLGRYIAVGNNKSYIRSHSSDTQFDSLMDSSEDFRLEVTRIPSYSTTPDMDVIAIYQKLYSTHSLTFSRGVLVTYYSLDALQQYINALELYSGQTILFLKDNHKPFFQNQNGNFEDIYSVLSPYLRDENTYKTFSINYAGISYLVSVIESASEGYYYVSLLPKETIHSQSRPLIVIFLLTAVAACVLSLILSLLNARQEYNQLQNIIDTFNNADKLCLSPQKTLSKSSNPYQIILYNVINLFLEQQYLKLQVENRQYQLNVMEMRALQYQINPHFLFNTLHLIYWDAIRLTNSPNICSSMISDLSEIVSYALTDSQEKVSIAKELEYVQHYTNIQKLRYNHQFKIIRDIDDRATDMAVIKMILQPLIENSIYHGIKPLEKKGIIKIKIYYQHHRIFFHVLDNGAGIPKDKLKELQIKLNSSEENLDHIGLLNINKRLVLTYGEASKIHLYSRHQIGTIVSFSIPEEPLTPIAD